MKNPVKQTVILVPGFCEPRPLLWPLALALGRPTKQLQLGEKTHHAEREIQIWRDRCVFRVLGDSIHNLQQQIELLLREENQAIAIVTHSFGDWVARQAIAGLLENDTNIDSSRLALVSIAPIMTASPVAQVLGLFTCGFVSEVTVMSDSAQASLHVTFGQRFPRLIIWANADVWIRKFDLEMTQNVQLQSVWATHLSIVLQPNVHRIVNEFLRKSLRLPLRG